MPRPLGALGRHFDRIRLERGARTARRDVLGIFRVWHRRRYRSRSVQKRRIRLAGNGHGLAGLCGAVPRARRAGGRSARAAPDCRGGRRVAAPAVGAANARAWRFAARRRCRLAGLGAAGLAALSAAQRARSLRSGSCSGAGLARSERRPFAAARAGSGVLPPPETEFGRLSGRTSWRCRLFSATRRRHARRRGPCTVALFRRLVGAAHRRVSSFLPGMNNKGDEPWRAEPKPAGSSEAADRRHVEATCALQASAEQIWRKGECARHYPSPAAGGTRARRWCRRTRTSSRARH